MTESASKVSLMLGDCLERLKGLPDNSVDSVVTDPPYGLSFMGKKWDYDVPSVDVWKECLRVLKPGGHLLAFAGTRTQHRMAVRIEDAGFEIRDMIAWVYGSGFPKSLDVSKAIDKAAGAEREVVGSRIKAGIGGSQTFAQDAWTQANRGPIELDITAPATEAARQWAGWGTALKPSFESLTYATKPIDCLGYCAKIIENLDERIELCAQIANNAEKSSRHSQADLQEVRTNTAPESAATRTEDAPENRMETGLVAATSSRVDTLELTREEELTALNTLLSWKNTLEGVFDLMKTSTTVTVFETITDWKILSFCLSQITPDTITKARLNPSGLNADALRAVDYLTASLACCKSTLALSVLEPAMFQEAENCRGVGVQPNLEPCIVARKPLTGTVAANVLTHGTGALNIDGCRVGTEDNLNGGAYSGGARPTSAMGCTGEAGGTNSILEAGGGRLNPEDFTPPLGRWPANLVHDGSDEVVGLFPVTTSGKPMKRLHTDKGRNVASGASAGGEYFHDGYGDSGSAARFFYAPKASKKDRDEGCEGMAEREKQTRNSYGDQSEYECSDGGNRQGNKGTSIARNHHPTVKPTDLMRYLCRLVTPPEGIVLDPFMGSGSTGKAAMLEGFQFIGVERDEEYMKIAESRIAEATINVLDKNA